MASTVSSLVCSCLDCCCESPCCSCRSCILFCNLLSASQSTDITATPRPFGSSKGDDNVLLSVFAVASSFFNSMYSSRNWAKKNPMSAARIARIYEVLPSAVVSSAALSAVVEGAVRRLLEPIRVCEMTRLVLASWWRMKSEIGASVVRPSPDFSLPKTFCALSGASRRKFEVGLLACEPQIS